MPYAAFKLILWEGKNREIVEGGVILPDMESDTLNSIVRALAIGSGFTSSLDELEWECFFYDDECGHNFLLAYTSHETPGNQFKPADTLKLH